MKSDNMKVSTGILIGFALAAVVNTTPWSDAEIYRRAIRDCEKQLPRDQTCIVVGVPKQP